MFGLIKTLTKNLSKTYAFALTGMPLHFADTDISGTPIVKDLNDIIKFLSAGVGVIVTGAIIVGGIQYMTAGDNPNAVAEAKKRITNALIALIAFFFMFMFLQWLIPGGVFK
jgi:predicted small integral membrane protein